MTLFFFSSISLEKNSDFSHFCSTLLLPFALRFREEDKEGGDSISFGKCNSSPRFLKRDKEVFDSGKNPKK